MSRGRGSGEEFSTRALSRFVAVLVSRTAPIVVDLGPAVGVNVTFLGQRLGCKLRVENLLADKETWLPKPAGDDDDDDDEGVNEPEPPERALRITSETVDGVLCWDVFDHLDQEGARALASEIMRVLKPGGVVFLCHRAEQCPVNGPGEYEVVDETTVYRKGADAAPVERVWQSRDMTRMFDQLTVADSFLLTSRMREMVLKRSTATARAN